MKGSRASFIPTRNGTGSPRSTRGIPPRQRAGAQRLRALVRGTLPLGALLLGLAGGHGAVGSLEAQGAPQPTPIPQPAPSPPPPPAGTQSAAATQPSATPAPVPPPNPTPTATPIPAVQPPELSVVLVIDVSGSMNNNNKLADAKQAALESISRYLTPGLGQQPTLPTSIPGPIRPGAVSLEEAARLDRFRELHSKLAKLQDEAGNLLKWSQKNMTDMRDLMNQMDELMEGVALEKKQALLKQLNPLIEKMHFAIAKKVNHRLGGGMRYMVSGKKSNHPDFGGLYANKMSDHDAIYVGKRATEAKEIHEQLAKRMLGDDWLRRTDSAMESGAKTFKAARTTGARAQDFRAFEVGAKSNNDWMRTVSGGGWVSDYVVEKGEVIDLDALKSNPDDARRTLQQTLPELKAQGVSFDPRGPKSLGYNLGAVSDFDRQYMLNLHRRQAAGEAIEMASVLQKEKYLPRFEQMLEQTGRAAPGELAQIKSEIQALKAGGAVTQQQAAALEAKFSSFRNYVREAATDLQAKQYQSLLTRAANARQTNPQLADALVNMAAELADDTQGAMHNYEQLRSSVNPVLGRAEDGVDAAKVMDKLKRAGGGTDLAERVGRNMADDAARFVAAEPSLARTVELERLAAYGTAEAAEAAAQATRQGGNTLIKTSQRWRDFVRQNPGTTLLYVAGLGWTGYEVYDALMQDDVDRAVGTAAMFAGQEAAAWTAEWLLATKYGYAAGSGGAAVAVAGIAGAAGYYASKSYIQTADTRRSLEIMTGKTDDNRTGAKGPQGFLEFMGIAPPSDDDLAKRYPPGQYKDLRIEVDNQTGAVTFRQREEKMPMQYASTNPYYVDDWDSNKQTVDRNELVARDQLDHLFNNMRGQYRDALDSGQIQEAGLVSTSLKYSDGYNDFEVPNPGGALTDREYVFYRKMFDENWGRYTLGQQPWPADELLRAKAEMFKRMMQSVVDGKQQDMKLQQAMDRMTPKELELMRSATAAGKEYYVNGRKLTLQDLDDRIELARSFQEGALKAIIDDFQQSEVPPEFQKEIDVLVSMSGLAQTAVPGSVEFGILAYSGSCQANFMFYPFTRTYEPLRNAITGLSAGGGTPMSPALYQARWAIWTEGNAPRGTIILLTDGQNDCSASPVEAADKIYQRVDTSASPGQRAALGSTWGSTWTWDILPSATAAPLPQAPQAAAPGYQPHPIDLSQGAIPAGRQAMPISVSTVGFQVNDQQQQELDAIAAAGGGQSVRAENMAQLTSAFNAAVSTAVPAAGGGGGGGGGTMAMPRSGINWTLWVVVGLLLGSIGLVVAIVAVNRRREAAAPQRASYLARIDVLYADGGRKSWAVTRGRHTLGRAAGNTLVLNDANVSSHHATLTADARILMLKDLGSRNGTFVNEARIHETGLGHGDVVTLGSTHLVVHSAD